MDRRAGKQAHHLTALRIVGMQTACDMLGGQRRLADVLSIGERAARAKLSAERGICYSDLTLAAKGLRARADAMIAHAVKLETLAEAAVHG